MKNPLALSFATLALYVPSVSSAQGVTSDNECEVRIITTDNVQIADSTDFKDGGLVGALMSGLYAKQDPLLAHDIAQQEVGEAGQERLMKDRLADLPSRFSGYSVGFEAGGQRPLAAYRAAKRTGRLSASKAPCLAEISVVAATYIRTSLSRTFGFALMYRQFGRQDNPEKVVMFGGSQKVHFFPPKSPDDIPTARLELRNSFNFVVTGLFNKLSKEK